MARYVVTARSDAPPEIAFDLWTNVAREGEWVRGVTRVREPAGPIDCVGTRFSAWFGGMRSDSVVIEVERPRTFATRFRNAVLRGTNRAIFEPDGAGTRVTETFETEGVVAAFFAWLFGHGSYSGSFQGELETFAALAGAEARRTSDQGGAPA